MLLYELAKSKNFKSYLEYHETLNPKLWTKDKTLQPEVKESLDKITEVFIEFLKIDRSKIHDIIVTGSNANYNWSSLSDIDLHIVVEYDKICKDCGEGGSGFDLNDCFLAKKSLWNNTHDITIKGHDIEVYVQPTTDKFSSNAGVFSLMDNKWVRQPTKEEKLVYDEKEIKIKTEELMNEIDTLIRGGGGDDAEDSIKHLQAKIKKMRQSAISKGGEFSIENLVFKALRNNGYMEKLYDFAQKVEDSDLSLK